MLRNTSQIPTTIRARGKTNVPQPAICEMAWIHQLVTVPRWFETNESRVKKPISARIIPRISSFRSFEILLHCQFSFEEVCRDRFERDLLLEEAVERDGGLPARLVVRAVDLLRLETVFLVK